MRKPTAATAFFLTLGVMICVMVGGLAQATEDTEIEALKARLEKLEACRAPEGGDTGGILKSIDASGGITVIGQGTVGNEAGDKAGANVSADLFVTAKPTEASTIALHFDMCRGSGVSAARSIGGESLFNTTALGIPNNDLEFNSDIPHLVEAWYEHALLGGKAVVSVGILDPTLYFDGNAYANDQHSQFLAWVFVNNPGIAWGGDADFYGPGIRLTASPTPWLDLSAGGFSTQAVDTTENEVVGFENEFDKPFAIVEADLKTMFLGREGNYRLYIWHNNNRENFPTFRGRARANTPWGLGGSFDQALTENLGLFLRFGKQDEKCQELEYVVSAGLSALGLIPARPADVLGIGYAAGILSDDYCCANAGLKSVEHWVEAYYSVQLTPNFSVSPDVQYVVNPGGARDGLFVLGLRTEAVF
ncbi:MAG: carbohydrate porin [Pseudomonadota bacterium]